jgi:DNA-binding transcriptional ArsR family regulator
MAIAVAAPDVEELERQAEALDNHAERLRAQARQVERRAREAAEEAADLRLQIGRRRREPVEILRQRIGVQRDMTTLARLKTALREGGPMKSSDLAERLRLPQQRVRDALRVLEDNQMVIRSGIRRGTIWALPEDAELLACHSRHATAYTLVRDAGIKLDTFDFETLAAELSMLTDSAIRRELPKLVADGIFEEARDGQRKIWAWIKPETTPVNRPKVAPPEAKLVAFARKSAPVAGTGRAQKARKDVGELLEACTKAGMEIEKAARHWRVMFGGIVVGTVPATPSDHRSLLNCRAEIQRNSGIEI